MEAFKRNPITVTELIMWKSNSLVNPRTSRDIKENGKLYNYIKNQYDKHFPIIYNYNIIDSIDDKDSISLVTFWIIENGIKKVVYEDISKLILYKDSKGFIRCFEKESLEYLKAHKITKHPVSSEEIPKEILDLVVEKNLERENMTIKDKAFEVFQHFTKISIFIDHEWFINLEKSKLLKFNYELREFYINNFTLEQQKIINNKILFEMKEKTLSKDEIITYLLTDMNILLNIEKEELKYMANYIIVGALGIVIPEIREMYPDFCFSF